MNLSQQRGGLDVSEPTYSSYQHVSIPVLLLFCSYVIIWYLQLGSRISALGAIRIEFVVACLLMPFALTTLVKNESGNKSPLPALIICYFILLLVMTLFSHDFQTSWYVFVNRVVKFSFLTLFIVCFVRSPNGMRFFLAAFMLACMKMGQEGFVGQISGSLVWQNQGVMRLHGSTMLYRHPNSFAGMALGTLPFVLYLFPVVNKWIKGLLLVQLFFALNIILYTGSRTGYLGLVGFVMVLFVRCKYKIKLLAVILIGVVGVLQFAPEQYLNRFHSIYISSDYDSYNESLHGGDSSKEKRIQIIRDSIIVFIEHPFGIGVSAFPEVRAKMFDRSQDTHNLYLEVLTNLGVQGGIIFASLIIVMLKSILAYRRKFSGQLMSLMDKFSGEDLNYQLEDSKVEHLGDLKLLIAVCDSLFLFVMIRLFLGLFGMDLYEIYWWFALGITIALNNILKTCTVRSNFFLK